MVYFPNTFFPERTCGGCVCSAIDFLPRFKILPTSLVAFGSVLKFQVVVVIFSCCPPGTMTSSMLRRQLKNLVQNYSEAEVKVREYIDYFD